MEGRVFLKLVSAVDDLGIRVRNVLYFGGLIAGEPKGGDQGDKLEALLIGNYLIVSLFDFVNFDLLDSLKGFRTAASLAESSAGSIARFLL